MSQFGSESSSAPWSIYDNSDASPSRPIIARGVVTPLVKSSTSSETSMSAISFGFVATAILISMFLIMAIFEHLFRPNPPFSSPQHNADDSGQLEKPRHSHNVPISYASEFSVMMPGERYPTFIAQPTPLPCSRERVHWPPHEHSFVFP